MQNRKEKYIHMRFHFKYVLTFAPLCSLIFKIFRSRLDKNL
jgi:hypothetical protein